MNDEWSNRSGFKFARKKVEFGVIEYDLVPLFEILASYHLIMPFFFIFPLQSSSSSRHNFVVPPTH